MSENKNSDSKDSENKDSGLNTGDAQTQKVKPQAKETQVKVKAVCPECGKSVIEHTKTEGFVRCSGCKKVFPINW